jgi:sulfur carrier protein
MKGIEPSSKAWEALALPLSYTRVIKLSQPPKFTRFKKHIEMIQLTINGQPHHFETPTNITQLIEHLELQGKRIAIERNGEIVPRSQFSEQVLADGDQLEVVVAVGGG